MRYINHFGDHSENYLKFRPDYPDALYHYLASLTPSHDLAWDVGTGNGQAAIKLAAYFRQVIATDIQQPQLDSAIHASNITYQCCPAEKTEIQDHAVDLITVAQALHWFSFDAFYREVRRVAKPNGVIAAWTYSLGEINQSVNAVIKDLYIDILGDEYWPSERKYVDEAYETIPFPFLKIKTPSFVITKTWQLNELIGYLNTWSAVKEYKNRHHQNPIDLIYPDLLKAWGNPHQALTIHWQIHLLVAKLS
jgi:SAM-dependent methyltransferase